MAGVSTQFSIQDRATSHLNTMINAAERLNRSLETTDALSDTIDPGAPFERSAGDIGAAGRQVDNFNNKQEQAENGAKKVKSVWSSLGGVIKSAVAAFSAKQVIELADSMTTTRARLDLMNDGLQTTAELQDMIMESANRSRAPYQTTADAVAKMGIMASDAFSSNEELIAFSELINKQFTIAGTSAAGIDAAMLQLTQAMSSGVLRGEELNSIFEQAPTIIQTIADYLGVPIGKIREMAAEGQITSTVVKNAMLASADEINAKFEASLCDNVLGPLLSKTFIYDNYASQKGKGTHFGLDRLKSFMQRYYRQFGADGWVLKCDISKYFYRINHDVLKSQLRRVIHDPDVLWLLDLIIDSTDGPGIPIGNHTSQWFAILYLSGMDHMIKERLGIKFYGRYMDDFYLIHPDKEYLLYCLEEIRKFLVPLGLELNHKTAVFPLSQGIDFLGFRTYMTDSGKVVRKLRRESKNRIRRKLKKFRHLLDEGRITFETVVQSYSSWVGHAAHGNSYHLIRNTDELFYDLFRKEMGEYHVKTTVDASRRRDREVGQHEV